LSKYDTNMKRTINIFLLFLFPSLLFGQSSAETKVRQKAKFNSDWKFMQDDKTGFESHDFDDTNWSSLDLPHNWGVEGEFIITIQATAVKEPVKLNYSQLFLNQLIIQFKQFQVDHYFVK
jgi:hypothetical protein